MFAILEQKWSWVVLVASFFNQFISLAFPFTLGIYNVEFLEAFEDTKANTAWVSSIHIAFTLGAGPVVAYAMARTSLRLIACLGAIVSAAGVILTIFATKLFHLYITIGVIMGSGLCMIYFPSAVVVGLYFTKNRTFATALSACGAAIGLVLLPVIYTNIIEEYAWRGSMYIIAGLCMQTLVFSALLRPIKVVQNIDKELESVSENQIQRDLEMKHVDNLSNNDSMFRDRSDTPSDEAFGSKGSPTDASCNEEHIVYVGKTDSNNLNKSVNNIGIDGIITRTEERWSIIPSGMEDASFEDEDVDNNRVLTYKTERDLGHCEITHGDMMIKDSQPAFDSFGISRKTFDNLENESMLIVEAQKTGTPTRIMMGNRRSRLTRILHKYVALKCKLRQNVMIDFSFLIYLINNILWNLGIGIVFVISPDYLYVTGADKSEFFIVTLMVGVGSVIGAALFAFIGKWKHNYLVSMYCGLCVACGMASALFAVTADIVVIGVLGFIVGMTYGTMASWLLAVLADLIGISKLSEAFGYLMLANGIGNLAGPPLGGWLYDVTGNYSATFWIAGSLIFVSGLLMAAVPLKQRYNKRPGMQLTSN